MDAVLRMTTVLSAAALLLISGCDEGKSPPAAAPAAPPVAAKPAAPQPDQVVVDAGCVMSINGTSINYPDSEKLTWCEVKDQAAIDPKLIALGRAADNPAITAKHDVIVTRYATLGDHILLCGGYNPPIRDGNICWVINTKTMKYVGHFLDKDSR